MKFEDLAYILPERVVVTGRKRQMVLIGVIVSLVVTCIALACLVGLHAGGHMGPGKIGGNSGVPVAPEPLKLELCSTTECLETAARLSENMDTSVDPCQDFHRYACGSWGKRHSIPPNKADYTVTGKMRDQTREKLREILEQPIKRNGVNSSERKLKQFFRMCLHDYGRMRNTGAALLDLVQQYIKGWYVLDPDNWQNNGWNLTEAIVKVQGDFNVDALLKLSVGFDWRLKVPRVYVLRGGTGMYYTVYLREDRVGIQDAYQDWMRRVGTLLIRDANLTLNASETERRVEQFVSDAYSQETYMAELNQRAQQPPYSSRVKVMTLSQLEGNFTQLPWRQMIQESFASIDFHDDMKVRIWPYGYFVLINELLLNESRNSTRDRIMNNYMVWNFISEYSSFLSWEYKFAKYRFIETAFGREEFPQTWTDCLTMAQMRLGSLMAAEFLEMHATIDHKKEVRVMHDHIQTALYDSIEHLHWMDNTTKRLAEEKVGDIDSTMVFPDSYFNSTFLDALHSNLVVNTSDGFFKTFLNVQRFQRYMRGLELQSGEMYYMWRYALSLGTAGSRPVYFWRSNYLLVPPGAIQSPFYVSSNPNFANFAGIGTVMAQQMAKSIGEQGKRVWTNGSYANWWSDDTTSGYMKAKMCFTNYFEGIKVGPFLVNGVNQTVFLRGQYQTRRVTDLTAGIRTGYKAYHDWAEANGAEVMPVGLKMTTDQAFFISSAQTQCYIRTPKASYNQARYQRMPEDALWNGALSHMTEFAEAFSCQVNTPMAQNGTCNVF